jgi:hypothetical protein
MLWTANRWAPLVTGFFFGPAAIRILAALVLEQDSYYLAHSITRTGLAGFLAVSLAVIALTSRFVGKHPGPTTVFDRLALTFFAVAALRQMMVPNFFPPWFLLSGVIALFAAWCFHRFTRVKLKRRHHAHHTEASMMSVEP